MKKSIARASLNNPTKPASFQPKTPSRSLARPPLAGKTVTLAFLEPTGKEFARVEFLGSTFKRIRRHARKIGITLDKYFKDAITEELSRVENTLSSHSRNAISGGTL